MNTAMKILLAIAIMAALSVFLHRVFYIIGPVVFGICIAVMVLLCFKKYSDLEERIEELEETTKKENDRE